MPIKRSLQSFGSTHLNITTTRAKYSRSSYLHIFRTDFLDYAHKPGRLGGVEGARAERVGKKEQRRAQRHGNQLIRDNSPFPLSLSPICPTTADSGELKSSKSLTLFATWVCWSGCYVFAQHLTSVDYHSSVKISFVWLNGILKVDCGNYRDNNHCFLLLVLYFFFSWRLKWGPGSLSNI